MRITSWSQDRQGCQSRTTRNDQSLHETGEEPSVTSMETMELQVTEVLKADFNKELGVAAIVT